MELIRRVIVAVGVLAAVWCAVRAQPLLVRVSAHDFAEAQQRNPPKALVWLGWLVSLLNWRAIGPTLLVATRSDPVLELVARDGRRARITLTALPDAERLLAHVPHT